MKFFDLHSHPSFKPIFNNIFTPWDIIPANDRLLGDIIKSQSCLQQFVMKGECNLICVSLYAVETEFIDGWLMRLGPIIGPLDRAIMQEMIGKTFDYPKQIEQERSSLNPLLGGPISLHILTKWAEYNPLDFTKLYILFSIEGGHAFYNPGNETTCIKTILADLTKFITKSDWLVIYITPSHLTPNIFMTHAHGVKILGKGKFIPQGRGISSKGRMFLDEIVKTKVLIDVKHMSLISRQEFYTTREWHERPILCSHSGVTGCSWYDKLNRNIVLRSVKKGPQFVKIRYKKPKGLLNNTYFNPSSINLYNEDILYVLKSKGLSGYPWILEYWVATGKYMGY